MLLEKIDELLKEVSTLTAQNAEEVEQLRIKYLSKKGEINALMADFRTVPADQKKEVGDNLAPCSSQNQYHPQVRGRPLPPKEPE